jgi:alkylation response protein AidB-like acyl-CoA dehydrogenase
LNFDYSEEQQLLAASVRRFVDEQYDFDTRKKIIASSEGYSAGVWSGLAEIGLLGLPLPVESGGFGGGAVDLFNVMEAFGHALVVEPYLSTILCARLIARAGSTPQRETLLPPVAAGNLKLAFAQAERGARYDLAHVTTRARKDGNGYVLDGEKCRAARALCRSVACLGAQSGADTDEAGISLFVVDAHAAGIKQAAYGTIDSMVASDLVLRQVRVGGDAMLGDEGGAFPLILEATDFAIALLCAEAVGAIKCANDTTLEYLKTRKQFGVPIGAFQALQHRMVDMVISGEQARSMASLACAKVDTERDPAERQRHLGCQDQVCRCLSACSAGIGPVARRHGHDRRDEGQPCSAA